jgi:VCBS repeat-containing protein
MFSVLIPHAQSVTRRLAIYASCLSSILLAAFLISIHGRLEPSKGMLTERGTPALASQIRPRLIATYGKLPLSFEANQGQAEAGVKFLSRGRGYGLFLTSREAVLELRKSSVSGQLSVGTKQNPRVRTQAPHGKRGRRTNFLNENRQSKIENQVVRLRLVGVKPDAQVSGREELPGKVNYFIGNDPKKWRTNVPTYAKVRYYNVYPGVDLEYYGNQGGQLEYDFIVAPGADPSAIALDVGAGLVPARGRPQGSRLRIDRDGDLVISAKGGEVRFHKPQVFQEQSTVDSPQLTVQSEARKSKVVNRQSTIVRRQFREGHFVLDARNRIHFALGPYDHSKTLVIDPELIYSTYLGGEPGYPHPGFDTANGIAVDTSGNAYVVGTAYSNDIPTVNPFQPGNNSQVSNVFVTKFNATGTALVYSTYLGGSGDFSDNLGDKGLAIAVDSAGSAYLTGQTCSSNFPTAVPLQASLQGGCGAFVTKFSPDGASLVYSTYLGGGGYSEMGTGIAVDSAGNAYLTGITNGGFPTFNPLQQSLSGLQNAFVTKLNAAGSAFVYSTYLGSYIDQGAGIAVDSSGSAYVIGTTNSTGFPTVNPFQPSLNGFQNAFVSKLNAAGSALVYSTYLGGSTREQGTGIAVDSSGNAYVTGATLSPDFPTVNPIQSKTGTAFVAKFDPVGSALIYSTHLGGSGCSVNCIGTIYPDEGLGIAVDSTGVAYVAGYTGSADFPTVNAIQASENAANQILTGFVVCLNPSGSALAYSTYLGPAAGAQAEANAIAVDSSGNAHVAGYSTSGFPTVNPVQSSPEGAGTAAFVAMISPPPAVAVFPGRLNFGNVLGGTTSPLESVTLAPLSDASVSLSSIAASGDFALVTTATSCPYSGGTLTGGAACTIDLTFTPTATGARSGTVTVTYTGEGSPETIALSGIGIVSAANLLPTSLTFGVQYVGTASSPQAVTLTNSNALPLTVSAVATSSGWTESNNCMPVAANSSCTINVSFEPTLSGPQTGTLTVTDYANNSPQTVALSGMALEPVVGLSTTFLNFAAQTVSTQSAPQTITLTNAGNGALTPLKITRTGPFAQTNTCGDSVAAGASCTISVTFSPLGAGTQSGTMTLTDNASNSPQTVELSGTGIDFALSSTTTSQTVSAGQTANYNLAVGSEDGFAQTVNLTCTGAPALSTCTLTPNKVNPSGATAATVAVAVSTTAPSTAWLAPPTGRSLPPSFTGFGRVFWLYGLLGLASLAVLATARKRRAAYLLGACLLLTVLWTACGGGSSTPAPKTIPGTPAGTYTVVVTGTAASTSTLTHTINLTLTVN